MKKIYMDNAATTQMDLRAQKTINIIANKKYGNPSSLHSFGREAKELLEKSRETIAKMINADSEEIIFTSGGTESDNFALQSVAREYREKGNHIIATKIEHPAILNTCKFLEKDGFEITYLGVDKYGLIDIDELKKTITRKTILVSVMHANNEIGTIQPI